MSSGSRAVPCGQTDITKLIVAFSNFANAPKNIQVGQPAFVNPGLTAYEAEELPS